MLVLFPPWMRRSIPKKRSIKRPQCKPNDFCPADYSPYEETDLRWFALKRHSLEQALIFDSTSNPDYMGSNRPRTVTPPLPLFQATEPTVTKLLVPPPNSGNKPHRDRDPREKRQHNWGYVQYTAAAVTASSPPVSPRSHARRPGIQRTVLPSTSTAALSTSSSRPPLRHSVGAQALWPDYVRELNPDHDV
ncbi:hypothetical protein B0H16DRAFT_1685418 [Mycena metata]|uniref:Uncharacterized protein n=1 Tax=Mycena metata TaxID=1033252 RepID=A0AAD7JV71_9AGAR|nr:hypothetical protein B0H16DRAFT_1685418 [Mycena metata]